MSSVDLGVIGNGMFGALVDGRGRFVWCCMDNFDGDPVFNCLVNNGSDKTGFYDVVLEGCERAEQFYHGASAILVTRLYSKGDSVEIRDFAPRFVHCDRIFKPFMLIRTVRRLQGDPRVTVRIRPTFQYNSTDGYQTRGSQHVRFCGTTNTWRATTNTSIRHVLEELPFLLPVEPLYIIFGTDESFTNSLQMVASEFELKTVSYWKQWSNQLCLPVEFQEVLVRAAMTLCLLQSEDCGGFLSSFTMGLPLGPKCGATRDSRVCRMLDECLSLPVLRDIGLLDVCRKFLRFAKEICFQLDKPQHTCNPWGSVQFKKREWAPYLAGYRGMGEVHSGGPLLEYDDEKEGEGVLDDPRIPEEWQRRTVVYGLLVVALSHAFFDIRMSEEICTPKLYEKMETYALLACDSFDKMAQLFRTMGPSGEDPPSASRKRPRARPPCGAGFFDDDMAFYTPQEDRAAGSPPSPPSSPSHEDGAPPVHTLTAILCWAAADRLQRIAGQFLGDQQRAEYWRRRSLDLHEEICRRAWNPQRGAFTTCWGGERVGPSLLRIAELGFVSTEDTRFRGTVRAFEEDAVSHAVCLGGNDGDLLAPRRNQDVSILSAPFACFMTNTLLWYCEALRSTGAPHESRRLLESLLRSSTHRGFLTEAIDLRAGELWGNVPSTASLLSLLRVAQRLSRSWREC